MKEALIIFVKRPEAGMVKTRLAAAIGPETARDLYRCFVEDTLVMAAETGRPVTIAFDPPETEREIVSWLGDRYSYMPQRGADIGERMLNAIGREFARGTESVVLIGSDLPDLPSSIVEEAFAALYDNGAVIAPSSDGGYYLIGFRQSAFTPAIFKDMPWSKPALFSETLATFARNATPLHQLPVWHDIDRPADLLGLIARYREGGRAGARTMAFIRERGLDIVLRSRSIS